MPAPDSDSYVTLSSEEELGDHSHRQAPPGRKGGTLAAPALRPQRRRTARGLLSPGSQAAAQNSTAAANAADQQEGSIRASSRLAAGRAGGRAAGRQQRQRPGQAAALAELQQARAGRVAAVVAHPAGQRRSRAHAVVEDSSSSGSGSPPAGSDSDAAADPWPRRRACRAAGGARSRTRFLRGGRDYAESGSDTDMADFIAGDGEEEPSASDGDGQQEPERGGGGPPGASPSSPALDQPAGRPGARGRRAAAGARGLAAGSAAAAAAAAWDDDSAAEEGSGASGDAGAAQAAGPGEEQEEPADEGEAAPLRSRKRRAAALVVSSESEDEAAALGGDEGSRHAADAEDGGDEGATATTPGGKRRRLRRVHGGSAPGSGESGGDPSPGLRRPPPSQQQQQQQQATPGSGSGDSLAARRQRRTPPPRPQLAAADRIRQAQQRWQRGGGPAGGSDAEEGEGEERGQLLPAGEEEDVSVLTDEGDPDASPQQSQGSEGEEGGQAGQPRRRDPRGGRQRRSGGDQGWQRAADVLGLGAYSPRQLFDIYVEYALLCYADPGYAESVRRSPTHEQYYRRAVDHIEFEMTRLRGSVASDAWKSSARGLLQALEALPGIETGWTDEDGGQELAGAACDACNRSRSHATRELILKGVPCEAPAWGDATLISNRRLSDQFATTSPVFKERQELPGSANRKRTKARLAAESSSEEEEEEVGGAEQHAAAPAARYACQRFHVGRFCCGRLALYHALFHWRRRLLARLKRELKAELRRRKRGGFPRDRSCVSEAVLRKESLMEDLYRNYRRLLELAERYQLSGGEESRGGWKSAFEGVHAEVEAVRSELHSGSEAEEGSVVWPDEAEASSGSDGEGGSQAGNDGTGGDGDEGAERERPDGGRPRLRQARIRFGAVPLQPTAPPAQQRTGVGCSGDGIRKQDTPPAQGAQPEATAAQETPPLQRPGSAAGRIRQVDIRSFFSPRQQQRQQETQRTE